MTPSLLNINLKLKRTRSWLTSPVSGSAACRLNNLNICRWKSCVCVCVCVCSMFTCGVMH